MNRDENINEINEDELVEDLTENSDSPADETPEVEEAVDEITVLREENTELKEKILRMAAENQNTRKRLVKQHQDAHTYRHQDILRDLADVIDNFERAIESSVDSRDFDNFHEGILMIEKQFSGMLTEKYGLERIGAVGDLYDPAVHEAMMLEESPEVDTETVKQVYQAGYRLHNRILRPAKVIVSKPAVDEIEADYDNADNSVDE